MAARQRWERQMRASRKSDRAGEERGAEWTGYRLDQGNRHGDPKAKAAGSEVGSAGRGNGQ